MNFSDAKVSTQTFIAYSNIGDINLRSLYEELETSSRIVAVSYKEMERGVPKKKKKIKKNFLNCVSCVVQIRVDKRVAVKIFNTGTFQLTGCKCFDHARRAVTAVWREMKTFVGPMDAYVVSVMRNIDFGLGFAIDRERWREHVANNTRYETTPIVRRVSAGIKLTIPVSSDPIVRKLSFDPSGRRTETVASRAESLRIRPSVESTVTITVFSSGKVSMSGTDETCQKPAYDWFVDEIRVARDAIEVKKAPSKTFADYLPAARRAIHFPDLNKFLIN